MEFIFLKLLLEMFIYWLTSGRIYLLKVMCSGFAIQSINIFKKFLFTLEAL